MCRQLVEHRLTPLVDSVRLVASELVTSTILHGNTPFTVSLSQCGDGVLLTVDVDASSPATTSLVPDLPGRSRLIVELLSRHWGVTTDRRDARTVWAYLDRGTARAEVT